MRTRGLYQRSRAWVVAVLVIGACATGAHAQTIFSAWPPCDVPGGLQGWPSNQWDDGGGVQGFALIQQVTNAQSSDETAAEICKAVSFLRNSLDVPAQDRPTSGFLYVWVGDLSGYTIGQFVPAADLMIPVTLPTANVSDTGATTTGAQPIYRLCAQITPFLDIPAGMIFNVALVAESNPAVAVMGGFDSKPPTEPPGTVVSNAIVIDLVTGQVIARSFPAPACSGIVALELFGPVPVPTVSEWGMVAMALLLLAAGTLVYARRGPVRHAA